MNIENIKLEDLFVSELNARVVDPTSSDIVNLAESIRDKGLLNPLTVCKYDSRYEIIAGQRRFFAVKILKYKSVPCNIRVLDKQQARELSIIENIQQKTMTTKEKVRNYTDLYTFYKNNLKRTAEALHLTSQTVKQYINMSTLPVDILDKVDSKKVTLGIANALSENKSRVKPNDILNILNGLSNSQILSTIKKFNQDSKNDIETLKNLRKSFEEPTEKIKYSSYLECDGRRIEIPDNVLIDILTIINKSKKP